MRYFKFLSPSQKYLLLSLLLGLFGALMVYSASASFGRHSIDQDSILFIRQCSFLGVGTIFMFLATKFSLERLQKISGIFLLLAFLSMLVLFIPQVGVTQNGATRWIRFFGIGIQPVELLKPAILIWLASFLSRKKNVLHKFSQGVLPIFLVLGFAAACLILQPDFGSIVLIFITVLLVAIYGGVLLKHVCLLIFITTLFSLGAVFTNANRLGRVITYLDPWADASDSGFQLVNSFIAFGSGGLFGRGIGNSVQKEFFLPFANTDFMFAIIGEELGFLGVICLLLVYFFMIKNAFKIVSFCKTDFARHLVFGAVCLFAAQSLLHFGVVLGLLPTKGIGLPFVSYGGSSLIMFMTLSGVVYRCGLENKI